MTNKVQTTNQSTFGDDVISAEQLVLVDFYADWCGPCKVIGPVVEELANEYDGKIDVRKINVDDNAELIRQLGIRGIPTLILFKDGQPAETVVGVVSKSALTDLIDRHAA